MHLNKLWRRLLPLYIASFFEGLMFWYAIEKVFMVDIGFTPVSISTVIIAMAVTGLLLEVPSGILADRWSRKGVLMIAYCALGISSLLLGLSDSVLEYTLASVLFAVYFSLHSGTYDSMIYDSLLEETGSRKGFEKYLGYIATFASAGLVLGSLLGGLIGDKVGLVETYLWSVPAGLIAGGVLIWFREPVLHKQHAPIHVVKQLSDTLSAVFKKGYVAWIVITIISTSLIFDSLFEINQLWALALDMPLLLYGPLSALLLLGYGLGGPLAGQIVKKRYLVILTSFLSLVAVCLLTVKNMPVIAVAQFAYITLGIALYTVALGKLHDALPSRLRSGSSSAVGTLTSLVFIPLIYLFGKFTEDYSVFSAATLFIPIGILSILGIFIITKHSTSAN